MTLGEDSAVSFRLGHMLEELLFRDGVMMHLVGVGGGGGKEG